MSTFDFNRAVRGAEERLGSSNRRRVRSDRGTSRLPAAVLARLGELTAEDEQPGMAVLMREVASFCAALGLRAPCRATVYKALRTLPSPTLAVASLPDEVRRTLYNLGEVASIPAHQLAFYCLNYGEPRALSFAAGLPWLALYQASHLRGWRPRSRGLLAAIMAARRS